MSKIPGWQTRLSGSLLHWRLVNHWLCCDTMADASESLVKLKIRDFTVLLILKISFFVIWYAICRRFGCEFFGFPLCLAANVQPQSAPRDDWWLVTNASAQSDCWVKTFPEEQDPTDPLSGTKKERLNGCWWMLMDADRCMWIEQGLGDGLRFFLDWNMSAKNLHLKELLRLGPHWFSFLSLICGDNFLMLIGQVSNFGCFKIHYPNEAHIYHINIH